MEAGFKRAVAFVMMMTMVTMSSGCAAYDNFQKEYLNKEQESDVVRIGVFEPLSGEYQANGELEKTGIELANELYPDALGKPVELVYQDNMSDLNSAKKAAQALIDKRVSVVLGSYGNALSIAGGELFEQAKLPAIAATNSNPLVTNTNEYYFRSCIVEAFQGVAAAKYAVEELGVEKGAVMREIGNDFSAAVCQEFSDKFASLTGNPDAIVHAADYAQESKDYAEELQAIANVGAEVVFLSCEPERAIAIAEQAKGLNLSTMFIGTDSWESDVLLEYKNEEVLTKMAFTVYFGSDTELNDLSKQFLEAYHEKYGSDKEPEPEVALGFDAYILAITAMNIAGTALDGEAIKDALARTKEVPGASGNITFDTNGDPIKSVSIMKVQNEKFTSVYVAEPTWGYKEG